MTDPYKILGVSPTDSDEDIKKAYKELVKKYHPDKYSNSPLNELADEKMAEINSAFDEIMNMRRGGSANSKSGNTYYSSGDNYGEVRAKIQAGDITAAERMLDAIDPNYRSGEWYFLKGSVCYTRGWLNDAYTNFEKATSMEPNNLEYVAALNRMKQSRNGFMNGNPNPQYKTASNTNGCGGCEMCQGLICADCCCELMGGDLISCC